VEIFIAQGNDDRLLNLINRLRGMPRYPASKSHVHASLTQTKILNMRLASIVFDLISISSVFFVSIILQEQFTIMQVIAGLLMAFGVYVLYRK
jgi:hypothetical protein